METVHIKQLMSYNDIKNRNYNNNVLFIKLEDLYEINNILIVCSKIKNHFKNSFYINEARLILSFIKILNISFHRTNKNNTLTVRIVLKNIILIILRNCFKRHF